MNRRDILIEHATTNNLKDITVTIPKHKITAVTGVSGSGKSSLVFSTLAAQSQRSVNASYSAYVQQLLPKYPAPSVGRMEHVPFSLVVGQKPIGGNARSTVGTYSDLYTSLRLLFSRMAKPFIGYSMAYSFNTPSGMCPKCQGLGFVRDIAPESLLDMSMSLNQGAVRFPTFQPGGWRLTRYTESGFFNNDVPLKDWSAASLELLLHGKKQKPVHPSAQWHSSASYEGLIPRIEKTIEKSMTNRDSHAYEKDIARISQIGTCPACKGSRLNDKARSSKIEGTSITDCSSMSIQGLLDWANRLNAGSSKVIVGAMTAKLANLIEVGLGYLSLDRTTTTLSGGETQRLKLANFLNSPLNDILYIFDEPSIGLHPHDLSGVAQIFQGLRDKGNTLVMVDHDPDLIKIADHIIDLGPEGGKNGGTVTMQGSYAELLSSNTKTGQALRNPGMLSQQTAPSNEFITITNVTKHNLDNVTARLPKRRLTVVTGVAGSGKSTLIAEGLLRQHHGIMLDQKPVHATNRSNLLTYLGVFDMLRDDFASATHKEPSMFSYNGKGGCPVCKGKGMITLDIAYLGETSTRCEECDGVRYSKQALQYRDRGLNIAQALALTAQEAQRLYPKSLGSAMRHLQEVGLPYLSIGQSLNTLSGGELQRLKLAKLLMNETTDLLVLDEPTSGLHESNIQQIIDLLKVIIDKRGITVVVIEHNLRFIGQADWIIDVGPGAGKQGGRILSEGPVQQLIADGHSFTAEALRAYYRNEPHAASSRAMVALS
ncbi:ATP-binding cassette domain-containing protein [Bifidobacterium aquikefiricola]|uniref:UvrABC system protein A n=1 Tax=Bifidobacterium aquikefiricola TaxID=3059038 RepID=A0AB39U522_9BIFI